MNIIQPSRLTFWRSVFALTTALSFLSVSQILVSAPKLGVDLFISKAWMGLVVVLTLLGLLSLLSLAATWSRYRERILSLAEFPQRVSPSSSFPRRADRRAAGCDRRPRRSRALGAAGAGPSLHRDRGLARQEGRGQEGRNSRSQGRRMKGPLARGSRPDRSARAPRRRAMRRP